MFSGATCLLFGGVSMPFKSGTDLFLTRTSSGPSLSACQTSRVPRALPVAARFTHMHQHLMARGVASPRHFYTVYREYPLPEKSVDQISGRRIGSGSTAIQQIDLGLGGYLVINVWLMKFSDSVTLIGSKLSTRSRKDASQRCVAEMHVSALEPSTFLRPRCR
jgi:hypothetical protein